VEVPGPVASSAVVGAALSPADGSATVVVGSPPSPWVDNGDVAAPATAKEVGVVELSVGTVEAPLLPAVARSFALPGPKFVVLVPPVWAPLSGVLLVPGVLLAVDDPADDVGAGTEGSCSSSPLVYEPVVNFEAPSATASPPCTS